MQYADNMSQINKESEKRIPFVLLPQFVTISVAKKIRLLRDVKLQLQNVERYIYMILYFLKLMIQ